MLLIVLCVSARRGLVLASRLVGYETCPPHIAIPSHVFSVSLFTLFFYFLFLLCLYSVCLFPPSRSVVLPALPRLAAVLEPRPPRCLPRTCTLPLSNRVFLAPNSTQLLSSLLKNEADTCGPYVLETVQPLLTVALQIDQLPFPPPPACATIVPALRTRT